MMTFRKTRRSRLHPSLGGPKLSRNRGGNYSRGIFFGILAILLIALLFARTETSGLLWKPAGWLTNLAHGIGQGATYVTLPFTSKVELSRQNAELRAQLTEAKAEATDRNLLAKQNADLQAALGRDTNVTKSLAYIVARPPQTPFDTLILDTNAHAAIGDIVSSGSVVLGTIDSADSLHARAALFSSQSTAVNVLIGTSVPAVLMGQGGGAFVAQVPQQTPIAIGDIASLPQVPGGVIAVVESIDVETGKSYETVHLSAPISLFDITEVEVWNRTLPQPSQRTASSSTPS